MILGVGGTGTITATVNPPDATNKNVSWTTSDADVATVANGVVTAKSAGTTTITATAGGKTATCTVNVFAESPESDFEFDNGTITGYNGTEKVVVIPSKINGVDVETIGDHAFYECENLTSITIPDSVMLIGEDVTYGCDVFDGCISLQSINVDGSNTAYSSDDGVLFNKDKTELIRCSGGKEGSYTIPDDVTSIWDYAFYECEKLTSLIIPDSVTSIGEDAFCCCTGLNSINVDASNAAYSSDDGVLYNNDKTTLVTYPAGKTGNSFTIPNSVSNIGYIAFEDCINLTSVTFQETSKVTTIGGYAFCGCTGLTSITIPNSVTSIGEGAFEDCTGLTSVTFQETSKVATIGDYAFLACTDLTSITIPNSVTDIGAYAFYGCTGLTSITIGAGGAGVTIGNNLLAEANNKFRDAYTAPGGGAGTYTADTYNGEWTKINVINSTQNKG